MTNYMDRQPAAEAVDMRVVEPAKLTLETPAQIIRFGAMLDFAMISAMGYGAGVRTPDGALLQGQDALSYVLSTAGRRLREVPLELRGEG